MKILIAKLTLSILILLTSFNIYAVKIINETGEPLLINKTDEPKSIESILGILAQDGDTKYIPINSEFDAHYDRHKEMIIAVPSIETGAVDYEKLKPATCKIYKNNASVKISKIANKIYCKCNKTKNFFGKKLCEDLVPEKTVESLFRKWISKKA